MPGKMQVFNIVVIALQYSLVILLYYFLYHVIKIAGKDLTSLSDPVKNTVLASSKRQAAAGSDTPPPRLVVIADKQALLSQTSFVITDSLTIGRSEHNDLVINDSFVSHEHACISKSKHNYLLADLSSTNGTLVNGQPVEEEIALADGDVIQIGAVTLTFER